MGMDPRYWQGPSSTLATTRLSPHTLASTSSSAVAIRYFASSAPQTSVARQVHEIVPEHAVGTPLLSYPMLQVAELRSSMQVGIAINLSSVRIVVVPPSSPLHRFVSVLVRTCLICPLKQP